MKFAFSSISQTLLVATLFIPSSSTVSAETSKKPQIAEEVGLFYKPNDTPASTGQFSPGDTILSKPTLWATSAQISKDVFISSSNGQIKIEAGTILPAIVLTNLNGNETAQQVFCTVARKANKVTTTSMFGVLGAKVADSLSDGQKCLLDRDGDGRAESGFLLNKGSLNDRNPHSIVPIDLNIAQWRELGPGNHVAISLTKSKRPEFLIEIFENGERVKFDSLSNASGQHPKRKSLEKDIAFPVDVSVFGAKFQVLSFEEKKRVSTISFSGESRDYLEQVPTETEVVVRFGY